MVIIRVTRTQDWVIETPRALDANDEHNGCSTIRCGFPAGRRQLQTRRNALCSTRTRSTTGCNTTDLRRAGSHEAVTWDQLDRIHLSPSASCGPGVIALGEWQSQTVHSGHSPGPPEGSQGPVCARQRIAYRCQGQDRTADLRLLGQRVRRSLWYRWRLQGHHPLWPRIRRSRARLRAEVRVSG
jgi:hypothetical protein